MTLVYNNLWSSCLHYHTSLVKQFNLISMLIVFQLYLYQVVFKMSKFCTLLTRQEFLVCT